MRLLNTLAIYILLLRNGIKSQMQISPNTIQIPQNINVPPTLQFPILNYVQNLTEDSEEDHRILKTVIIKEVIDRKKTSKIQPIIEMAAVLKRLKRSPYSDQNSDYDDDFDLYQDDDEPETVYLFDFLIDNYLHFVIRDLNQKGYIEKNGTTTRMVRAVIFNFIVKSEFYLAATRQIDDNLGVCETFNTPRWWSKKINIPDNEKPQKLIDVFFEAFLRQVFKWLCENEYIYSRNTPLEVAAHGLSCTKKTPIYEIITDKHASDDIGLWKTLSITDWWLQLGTLKLEGKVLQWYPIKNMQDNNY